jgi:two-component system, OmpR family, response regulator VicR
MPHILVIEDDAGLRETFQLILENEGYQVSLFASIFEDAAAVERLHPDLILLDVWVEGMNDGFTMLQMLRSSPRTRSLPVIFCTVAAHPKIHEKVEALREQGLPVIYKPFDLQDLLQAVRKSLSLEKEQIDPGS